MRNALSVAALAAVGTLAQHGFAETHAKKFYADDPLLQEPAPLPAKGVAIRKVDHVYDFLENSYVTPRREGKLAKHSPKRALDVNTLGELPDSSWYTNRHASRRMSIADLQRGPGNGTPPDANGSWRITAAKSDGITPGFVIEDKRNNRYVLKFDPPQYPEMCSAADVIGSKLFYALGYNTPENYIVHFRPDHLEITKGVIYSDPNGRKTPLTRHMVDELLRTQPKLADGTYRALASRWLDGEVAGPFDYRGTRSDDPNDTIPHEHRRVLRGLAVFSAWVNHHDTSQINTMDTLVSEDGGQYFKHYLIDFGSTLGSRGNTAKHPWIGHQYTVVHKDTLARAASLGLFVRRWERSAYPKLKGVGLFDAWSFEPLEWKPEVPNPAFLMMDNEDAFWAAKQVAAFTDDEIRAIVETGRFSDPRAADWITECLIKRRDKIAEAWLGKVLALDRFRVADGRLAFDDLSAKYGTRTTRSYEVRWSTYDNNHGVLTPLSNASGPELPSGPTATEYLAATIQCAAGEAAGACAHPVTVYLRRSETGFQVVGLDR
ncbi:MAG: hypothetical protein SFV54_22625 [Bryobacteraceae bacterium]|nr:hypothetical protein [Bryobacteraceae bacterium]